MQRVRIRLQALLLVVVIAMCSQTVSAAEKAVGIRAGYSTRNTCPMAGLSFQYAFTPHFRLAPSADYMFRHHGTDAFAFNLNAQFPISLSSDNAWRFYPLAGVAYCNWNHHRVADDTHRDVSTHTSRFGANFGAGVEYMCTSTLKLSLEGKYNMVKSFSAGVFNIGIAYVF